MRIEAMALVLAATAAACGPGRSAHAPAASTPAACENVVQAAILPDGMVQDLGTVAVGTTAQFTIGAGVSEFVIVSQEVGTTAAAAVLAGTILAPNAVVPTNLRSPSGALYYDDFAGWPTTTFSGTIPYPDTTGLLAFDAGFQPAVGIFPFPSTSAGLARLRAEGQVEPGTWTFTLNDWANRCPLQSCAGGNEGGRYRVSVVTRPGALPGSGTLDVEVYLATGSTSVLPSAAAAAASPQVARWKQTLAAYLANAGIALGQVTFHDVADDAKSRYAANGQVDVSSSDPCSAMSRLFTSAGLPRRAVSVFLADVLVAPSSAGGAFKIVGVDGSIPGPSGFPGTIYSGAIVGLEDFGFETVRGACARSAPVAIGSCGTDRTAYVAAHEIGHWLGLFHTTESDGTFFDPLGDTAPCPCHACAPTAAEQAACADVNPKGTSAVTNAWCVASASCGGGQNLMFWLLSDVYSTGAITPDQAQLMRLNPAVQ